MFFKIFDFIFYARTIKPVQTFEYFGFVFSKLKLNSDYKFLIGLFILMLATIFHVHVCFLKTTFSVLIG